MDAYWIFIITFLIIVLARVIFRILTRHYEETVGQIVDFKTETFYRHNNVFYHSRYQHKPIVEFFANGKAYRCVKATAYYSSSSDWNSSLIKSTYRDYVKVRYDPKDPRKSYCLYSLKDFKYNIIVIIPALLLVLILFLYGWLHS